MVEELEQNQAAQAASRPLKRGSVALTDSYMAAKAASRPLKRGSVELEQNQAASRPRKRGNVALFAKKEEVGVGPSHLVGPSASGGPQRDEEHAHRGRLEGPGQHTPIQFGMAKARPVKEELFTKARPAKKEEVAPFAKKEEEFWSPEFEARSLKFRAS